MSFIATNQKTGLQVVAQIGGSIDLQVSAGDSVVFSGGGWMGNVPVTVYANGVVIKTATTSNDFYGNFITTAYTVPSGVTLLLVEAYIGIIGDVYGGDFPWGYSGTINLINTVPVVTVTFTHTAGGTITVSHNAPYTLGQIITITATPLAGYTFVEWQFNGGMVTINPTWTLYAQNGAVYNAVFSQEVFTLTITRSGTGDGNVSVTPQRAIYALGEQVTLIALPQTGSVFSGWYNVNAVLISTSNPYTITMTTDVVIDVRFTRKFGITVNIVGTGIVLASPNYSGYDAGTVVTLTATPQSGNVFVSWGGDASGTNRTTTVTMNADKVVTATFSILQYNLTIQAPTGSGSTDVAVGVYPYNYGIIVSILAIPITGWKLDYWLLDNNNVGNTNPKTVTMTANHTLKAVFIAGIPTQYTLSVTTSGGGAVTLNPPGGTYNSGTVVTLTANPPSGGTFTGWSGSLSGAVNPTTITMNGNKSVGASFTGGTGIKQDVVNIFTDQKLSIPANWQGVNITKTVKYEWVSTKTTIIKASLKVRAFSNRENTKLTMLLNGETMGYVAWTTNPQTWQETIIDVTSYLKKVSPFENAFKFDYVTTFGIVLWADVYIYADLLVDYTGDEPKVTIPDPPFDWEKYLPYIVVGGVGIFALSLLTRGGGGVTVNLPSLSKKKGS